MENIILLIDQYRYLILFPLAIIEGPIVALVVGFLIRSGDLAFVPSAMIMLLGDFLPDTFYYYVGYFGNYSQFIQKYRKGWENLDALERVWQKYQRATIILVKLAYGFSIPFLISAGLFKIPYRRYISYAMLVTILQYGIIMACGYFLQYSYDVVGAYVQNIELAIGGAILVLVTGYFGLSLYARHKILESEGLQK